LARSSAAGLLLDVREVFVGFRRQARLSFDEFVDFVVVLGDTSLFPLGRLEKEV